MATFFLYTYGVKMNMKDAPFRYLEGVPYGKTECWYIVEAEEGVELIIDHTARQDQKMNCRIKSKMWSGVDY